MASEILNTLKITTENKPLVPALRFKEFDEEWRDLKFGKLGELKGGGTPSTDNSEFWDGNIPWISSSDVNEGDITNLNITRYITNKAITESATKIIPKGSVLFVSRVGVGKLAVTKEDLCTSQDFANLIPAKDSSYFIAYYFIARNKLLHQYSQGTSIKGFTNVDLKSIPINIPSLPEQQKIASFLSAVDEKIQHLTKKKGLLEEYKKGVMQQLFSGQLRFKPDTSTSLSAGNGEEYLDWEEKRLGEICESIKSGKSKPSEGGVIPLYGSTGIIGKCSEPSHQGEFILIARVGANAGTINLIDDNFGVSDNTLVVVCKPILEIGYIYYFLGHYNLNRMVFGSGQPLITGGQLKALKLKLPNIEEQQKIATYLSGIDTKIESVHTQITQTQRFKKGLLQKMFV